MEYQRHPLTKSFSKLIDILAYRQEIIGIENLKRAHGRYPYITYASSHTDNMDFYLLNSVVTKHLGWENHPVFIYRDDLRIPFLFDSQLPQWFSTWFIETLGKSIPISQKGGKSSLRKIVKGEVKNALEEGKRIVLFPGATRKFGVRNPYIEITTNLYIRNQEKYGIINGHAFVPIGMIHDEKNKKSIIRFGEAIEVYSDSKNIGKKVWIEIADLTETDISDIVDEEEAKNLLIKEIREHIKIENRTVHD
ncbi:hypothetical protein GOV08_00365 [Candidatus Woesearchaeota archaeon]|nr:hypothetical protein [Candidatus Woesearchaeota archaeon]